MVCAVSLGRRATYRDVLDAPAHQVAEIIDGELCLHPRAPPREALARYRLGVGLGHPFACGRSGPARHESQHWWLFHEPELRLGEELLVPDLAGWRRERLPELPATASFTLAPDWVCEVLSSERERLDLQSKRPLYASEGVHHLWLVDVDDRTLQALELCGDDWVPIARVRDEEMVSIAPFEATLLRLGNLWP